MGIRGLGGFIKWKIPGARKAIQWARHAGETWGIDCSCLLYRANGAGLSALTVVASLIVRMRRAGVTPVFIFDGKTTEAKSEVVEQRRVARAETHKQIAELRTEIAAGDLTVMQAADAEKRCADLQKKAPIVTSGEKDTLKKFLYAAGILFVTASGEADDVLAYLCREGFAQGVVSTDMDMLARGVPLLVLPETTDASVLTEICLAEVVSGLGLNYKQFVEACMLMGSDYSGKKWRSVEPRHAVEMARRGIEWSAMDSSGSLLSGIDMLTGAHTTWEMIMSPKQREKWSAGVPPREPENLATIAAAAGWPADWVLTLAPAPA